MSEALDHPVGEAVVGRPGEVSFWSYLRHREIDFLPSARLRWWLVTLITLAWAAEQFERLRLSPVLVYFLDDFDLSLTQYGAMHLAGVVASGVGSVVLGSISDRHGRRPAIVWPMVLYVPILVGLATAPNVAVYITLFTLGAFLIMGMSAAVNAAIRDVMPRLGRAMAYAFVSLAWTLGAFATQGVAALTLPIWPGWRPQHWFGVAVAALITTLIYCCYRDLSPSVRTRATASSAASPAASRELHPPGEAVYRHLHIWLVASVLLWWGITYGTFVGMLPTYLTQWHGIAPGRAATVSTLFFFVAGISGFVSAFWSDRTGLRKLVLSCGVTTVGVLTIAASFLPRDASYVTVLLVWLSISLFSGFLYPSWCALLAENAEDVTPLGVGRAFGLSGALTVGVGLVIALVLPQVVERLGWNVWMIVAGCCAISNVVWISFAKGPWLPIRRLGR